MKKYIFTLAVTILVGHQSFAQSLAVNTTGAAADASAMVDISSTTKGLLIPRVSLTATNTAGPITAPVNSLLVYNIATASGGTAIAVSPGYYHWDGASWVRHTNNGWVVGTGTATTNAIGVAGSIGYLGTSTNSHLDLVSNNIVRGRLTNNGNFYIGSNATLFGFDLTEFTSNATYPWALTAYSNQNGSAVYGQITGGTTTYAGVQGEYNGTNAQGAGVRGLASSNTAGTTFTSPHSGVIGQATTIGAYKFGVFGTGGATNRSGGVLGNDFGLGLGALGYYSSVNIDYSVYGFGVAYTIGLGGGRTTNSGIQYNGVEQKLDTNTNIGLGIYGGVMGGWVRGLKYGFNTKGETYSLYIDGKGYTNEPIVYLMPTTTDERVAGYMATTLQPEISCRGKVNLLEGRAFVSFDENFRKVITGKADDMMITATPQGNTKGVYVDDISSEGFWIKENNDGRSNTSVVWMVTSAVKNSNPEISPELLNKNFDLKMNSVMFNENNTKDKAQPIWWDGTQMRWDTPPSKKTNNDQLKFAHPTKQMEN